ncbi:MAG: hypothetical protein ACOYJC_11120 [Christensenellales bacterium]|jgi:hypothetical protein
MFVIVLVLFLTIILFDCLTLLKKVSRRGKIIYFFMLLVSFSILVPYSLNVSMPGVSSVIKDALNAILPMPPSP